MKRERWVLTSALCLLLAGGVQAGMPEVHEAEDCEGYSYVLLEDGTAEICQYDGEEEDVVVPGVIDGYQVTGIGAIAFSYSAMESVTLPEGITYIGDCAFSGSESLSGVVLPESLTRFEASVFSECEDLKEITLPDSLEEVGQNPFFAYHNTNIDIHVSDNHPYLVVADGYLYSSRDRRLIYAPDKNDSFYLPDGTVKIGAWALAFCKNLKEVILPGSLTEIGDCAFANCENLLEINLPDSLTDIAETAFNYCENLTITVTKDSYAHHFCEENGLNYTCIN